MAKHGRAGIYYKPDRLSFLVLKADAATPFKTVVSVDVQANSTATGRATSFWTADLIHPGPKRMAIKLKALAVPLIFGAGTNTPTGDITVILTNSDTTIDNVPVTDFDYLDD